MSEHKKQVSDSKTPNSPPNKKVYVSPSLTVFGDFRRLTLGSGGLNDDGDGIRTTKVGL